MKIIKAITTTQIGNFTHAFFYDGDLKMQEIIYRYTNISIPYNPGNKKDTQMWLDSTIQIDGDNTQDIPNNTWIVVNNNSKRCKLYTNSEFLEAIEHAREKEKNVFLL